MSKDIKVKIGSTLYSKIDGSRLSERERDIALHAMRDGEAIADAIFWVVRAVGSLKARTSSSLGAQAH
jgi:hypothetical protein